MCCFVTVILQFWFVFLLSLSWRHCCEGPHGKETESREAAEPQGKSITAYFHSSAVGQHTEGIHWTLITFIKMVHYDVYLCCILNKCWLCFGFLPSTFQSHSGNVTCVDFSSNGKYLASCADDRTVRIWSTKDFLEREHKCLRANVELDHATLVRFSPDSRSVLLWVKIDTIGYNLIKTKHCLDLFFFKV